MESPADGLTRTIFADQPPSQFVATLQTYASNSRTANHPLLLAVSQGEFRDLQSSMRCFFGEYYFYSHQFTRYLGAVISNLQAPEHRAALIANSAEEAGHINEGYRQQLMSGGINPDDVRAPHPELFRRFLHAVDMDPNDLRRRQPLVATSAWTETFHGICRYSGEGQAVGALGIATEGIVGNMYRLILQGIARAWPTLSAYDRAFFDLHAMVDDDHAEALRGIATSLSETIEGRWQIALGMRKALDARGAFFDFMLDYLAGEYQTGRRAA